MYTYKVAKPALTSRVIEEQLVDPEVEALRTRMIHEDSPNNWKMQSNGRLEYNSRLFVPPWKWCREEVLCEFIIFMS